jgi:hypothetical protein
MSLSLELMKRVRRAAVGGARWLCLVGVNVVRIVAVEPSGAADVVDLAPNQVLPADPSTADLKQTSTSDLAAANFFRYSASSSEVPAGPTTAITWTPRPPSNGAAWIR